MKKITLSIALFGMVACAENNADKSEPTDPNITHQEVTEIDMGNKKVYGVSLDLTTNKKYDFRGVVVTLKVDEKVWYDTSRIELTGGDTLFSEVIFSDAEVTKDALVSIEAKTFSFE